MQLLCMNSIHPSIHPSLPLLTNYSTAHHVPNISIVIFVITENQGMYVHGHQRGIISYSSVCVCKAHLSVECSSNIKLLFFSSFLSPKNMSLHFLLIKSCKKIPHAKIIRCSFCYSWIIQLTHSYILLHVFFLSASNGSNFHSPKKKKRQ